jgi:hypothetical protein
MMLTDAERRLLNFLAEDDDTALLMVIGPELDVLLEQDLAVIIEARDGAMTVRLTALGHTENETGDGA